MAVELIPRSRTRPPSSALRRPIPVSNSRTPAQKPIATSRNSRIPLSTPVAARTLPTGAAAAPRASSSPVRIASPAAAEPGSHGAMQADTVQAVITLRKGS